MARITGTVVCDNAPAANAYVQLRDTANDFIGETRTHDDGSFVLYAVPGAWKLVSWLPSGRRGYADVEIAGPDIDVGLSLEPVKAPTLRGSLSR